MNQKRFQKIRSDWRNFPSSLVWANSTAFNWVLREVVVNLIRKQICLHSYLAEANVGLSFSCYFKPSKSENTSRREQPQEKTPFAVAVKTTKSLRKWNQCGELRNGDAIVAVSVSGQAPGGHCYNTVAEESWFCYRGLLAVTIWYNWLE